MQELLYYQDGKIYYIMDGFIVFCYPNLSDFQRHIEGCNELVEKILTLAKKEMDEARIKNLVNGIDKLDELWAGLLENDLIS